MADWLDNCTKQDWGTSGGSWTRSPVIICLHSTEGTSWPGYSSGQSAPHFTINLSTGERRQHISMGVAARALANPSGGVETNRAGPIQIEIIGTCDPARKGQSGWLYLPEMNSTHMSRLSTLMRDIVTAKPAIPWACGVTFGAYPGSYGNWSGRLSGSAWSGYKGVLGHQHVPENDHGDPGNIPITSIMGVPPAPQPTPPSSPTAPRFPYPSSDYLGTTRSDPHCHSGYYASDQPNIRTWQQQMKNRGWTIGVDGLYGSQSESVCRSFQREKGLGVDGLVGPKTWGASWTEPVT